MIAFFCGNPELLLALGVAATMLGHWLGRKDGRAETIAELDEYQDY